jgi:hypothetical protein
MMSTTQHKTVADCMSVPLSSRILLATCCKTMDDSVRPRQYDIRVCKIYCASRNEWTVRNRGYLT